MAGAMARRGFFAPELFEFLLELTQHNDRTWFEANRARYEALVREPALGFIRAMQPRLRSVSTQLLAEDRKVGGSLMRVHRDTRFARDKTPYKTNVGIQFRHAAGKDVHAPGLYFHIALDGCFLGLGCWRPEPEALAAIRARIHDHPKKWQAMIGDRALAKRWTQDGESLTRPPRGVAPDHPCVEDLKRKDFILTSELAMDEVLSPRLDALLVDRAGLARGYLRFLCDALDVRS